MRFGGVDETGSLPRSSGFSANIVPPMDVASPSERQMPGSYLGSRDLTSTPLNSQSTASAYGQNGYQQQAYPTQTQYVQPPFDVRQAPASGFEGERFQQFVTVQPGDSLSSIAARYNMSEQQLAASNGLRTSDPLYAGQQLSVANAATPVTTPVAYTPQVIAPTPTVSAQPNTGSYVVRSGDTLYGIARMHNMSATKLAAANGMSMSSTLKVGQKLSLDTNSVAPISNTQMAVAPKATPKPTPVVAQIQAPVSDLTTNQPVRVITPNPQAQESALVKKAAIQPDEKPAERIANNSFRWPATGRVVSGFGKKPDGTHNDGIDISVPEGTPVKAAENGVVVYAGAEIKGYGNLILVRHADDYVTAYAHNKDILVKRGDSVTRGQDIATAGSTGNASSPTVHFEIRKGAKPVDPKTYLPG
jgi:murein DD-endopeptidase MepM/ murein hydrolase activator NlpD